MLYLWFFSPNGNAHNVVGVGNLRFNFLWANPFYERFIWLTRRQNYNFVSWFEIPHPYRDKISICLRWQLYFRLLFPDFVNDYMTSQSLPFLLSRLVKRNILIFYLLFSFLRNAPKCNLIAQTWSIPAFICAYQKENELDKGKTTSALK